MVCATVMDDVCMFVFVVHVKDRPINDATVLCVSFSSDGSVACACFVTLAVCAESGVGVWFVECDEVF